MEQRLDSQGSLHLRRPRELRPRHKRIANWLGLDYSHKLTLDENGTRYFALVNGTRTLRAIADAMATATQRDPREMDKGVLLFTKQLMTRHLIELKLPATTHAE